MVQPGIHFRAVPGIGAPAEESCKLCDTSLIGTFSQSVPNLAPPVDETQLAPCTQRELGFVNSSSLPCSMIKHKIIDNDIKNQKKKDFPISPVALEIASQTFV